MQKTINTIISLVLVFSMLVGLSFINPERYLAADTYSAYVSNVLIAKSGNNVTVSYTAGNVPNGATCYIGYEDWTGTIQKKQLIGTAGKHTVTWTITSEVFRVYTVLVARNYTDKDIIKTFYNVKTGTSYYRITQQDVKNKNVQAIAGNVIVGLSCIGLGFWHMSAGVIASSGSIVYGIGSIFSYSPSVGDLVETTRSYDKSTENLTIKVNIYRNGMLLKTSKTIKHIGF